MKELTGKAGNHPGLSGYALKYLAAAFMLCDHVAYFVIRRGLYAPWMSPEGGISFSDAPAYLFTANRVYWAPGAFWGWRRFWRPRPGWRWRLLCC
ncbi:hypothetical protein [Dysosmobacter sp.]